jgi:SAM-dependent methyltransferase
MSLSLSRGTPLADPLQDGVAQQYERWIYPRPIEDIEAASRESHEQADPAVSHRLYWPDREYPEGLEILVAGCGANQAAAIAFGNPQAHVIGIDVSEASLAHEQRLKEKHRLDNLVLARLPIEAAGTLGRDFDLIISTGVLHHLAEPLTGLRALAPLLRRDGAAVLMLYGKHARQGVETAQALFRLLGLDQSPRSIALVRDILERMPAHHPVKAALGSRDTQFDAGMVDLFLHERERSYTVRDCLDFVAAAGLAFQGWLESGRYDPRARLPADSPAAQAIGNLSPSDLWSAAELFSADIARHFFIACRPDRARASYTIDFAGERCFAYVPHLRRSLRLGENPGHPATPLSIERLGNVFHLGPEMAAACRLIDGRATIGQIAAQVFPAPDQARAFGRAFFGSLWRFGLVTLRI